jgi:hypothetical protein
MTGKQHRKDLDGGRENWEEENKQNGMKPESRI